MDANPCLVNQFGILLGAGPGPSPRNPPRGDLDPLLLKLGIAGAPGFGEPVLVFPF